MKQLTNTLLGLMLVASTTIFGQTPNKGHDEVPFIEVVGAAEKEIVPDEIYIAVTIRERQNGKDKITVEQQELDLKSALQGLGISLDNLFLSDANANYIRVKWSKKDVVTKTEYMLKVGDAPMVGKVFEKLDELKITEANIARVSHSKLEELKKEVRILAIKAAKEKAGYLLSAIGQETGKAIKVYEQAVTYRIDDSNLNVRGGRSEASYYVDEGKSKSLDQGNIIQFEKIKLQSAIYVKFEIK